MKKILLILALLSAAPVWATTYYMRADGSAANKAAATSCSAASTAMNVTTHNAQTFSAGDTVTLCDTGGVFRDAILTPPSSGSVGSPITYTNSGSPVVSAGNLVTGWDTFNQSISHAPTASLTTGFGYRITIPANTYTVTGASIKITLAAGAGATGSIVSGAYIGLKAGSGDAWAMQAGTITQFLFSGSGGVTVPQNGTVTSDALTFSFDPTQTYIISIGTTTGTQSTAYATLGSSGSFYKSNDGANAGVADPATYTAAPNNNWYGFSALKVYGTQANTYQAAVAAQPYVVATDGTRGTPEASTGALTADGQWYWVSGSLYLYSTTAPSGRTVEAGARLYCVQSTAKNYLTINGLACQTANNAGMYSTGTNVIYTGNTITNAGGQHNYDQGIYIAGANSQALRNTISHTYVYGITTIADSSIIEYNLINDCWDGVSYIPSVQIGHGAGINVQSSNALVAYNYVTLAYQGMQDLSATNDTAIYNVFANSLLTGIGHGAGTAGSPLRAYGNTIIHNPIFVSGHGLVAQGSGDGFIAENNICYEAFTGANTNVECMAIDSTSYTVTVNNNLYYIIPGGTGSIGELLTTQYTPLSAWKTALAGTSFTGKDANSISADPLFTNYAGADYSIKASSPAANAGINLGSTYQMAICPGSTWPNNVTLCNQNSYGTGWEIGAFVAVPSSGNALWFGIP